MSIFIDTIRTRWEGANASNIVNRVEITRHCGMSLRLRSRNGFLASGRLCSECAGVHLDRMNYVIEGVRRVYEREDKLQGPILILWILRSDRALHRDRESYYMIYLCVIDGIEVSSLILIIVATIRDLTAVNLLFASSRCLANERAIVSAGEVGHAG